MIGGRGNPNRLLWSTVETLKCFQLYCGVCLRFLGLPLEHIVKRVQEGVRFWFITAIDSVALSPTAPNGNENGNGRGNGNGRKRNMLASCSAFYGTHKFRANCCTGNWFCLKLEGGTDPPTHLSTIAMAISILQDRQVLPQVAPFDIYFGSSSLLQFCLNYFACLFMVESLISGAGVACNLDDATRLQEVAAGCGFCSLPHAWPRSRQRIRRRIEERVLPAPSIYDRRRLHIAARACEWGSSPYKCFEKWIIHVSPSCCSWAHEWKYSRSRSLGKQRSGDK